MRDLLKKIQLDYPDITFMASEAFCWSPSKRQVSFVSSPSIAQPQAICSLLHELAHALLEHSSFKLDLELLEMEVSAWQKAGQLANQYGYPFDSEHSQNCLDSYRDWLHLRSTCPVCQSISPQEDPNHYRCFNCDSIWRVSNARFCRPYRRLANVEKAPTLSSGGSSNY